MGEKEREVKRERPCGEKSTNAQQANTAKQMQIVCHVHLSKQNGLVNYRHQKRAGDSQSQVILGPGKWLDISQYSTPLVA